MRTRNQEKKEEEELRSAEEVAEDVQPNKGRTPNKKRKPASEASTLLVHSRGASEAGGEDPSEAPPTMTAAKRLRRTSEEPDHPAAGKEEDADGTEAEAVEAPLEAAVEGGGESEDEAPEEISLNSGKLAAQKQVEEEKKERAVGRRAGKKKRRSKAAADEEDGGGEGLDVEAQEALDVLPVEVIAALQRQAREEALQAAQASSHRNTSFEEGAQMVDGEVLPYRQDGPVTVRILDDTSKPSFNPSESAKEYAKKRLYGARLKRSTAMLHPVGGSRIQI